MEIKHNNYFEGKVQSLGFTTTQGQDATIGVVAPGKYDFGIAKRQETITAIKGSFKINGCEVNAIITIMRIHVIHPGEQIIFETSKIAAYICVYD